MNYRLKNSSEDSILSLDLNRGRKVQIGSKLFDIQDTRIMYKVEI